MRTGKRLWTVCAPFTMMCALKDPFLVLGAGSHAHRVAEAIYANGGTLLGFATTDGQSADLDGARAELTLRVDHALQRYPDAAVVVAIGAVEPRSEIIESMRRLGRRLPAVVHPRAIVSPAAEVADGVVVLAAATIEYGAAVGLGAIIDVHSVICHEARIGAMTHIQPGTIIGPRVRVPARTRTQIGERILEEGL
jgi:UDP-3-O-[3-hydroxymyristoyl] glucosamine N-acyltransferase